MAKKFHIKARVLENPKEFDVEVEQGETIVDATKKGFKQAQKIFAENTIIEQATEVKGD